MSNLLLYTTEDEKSQIKLRADLGTVGVTQLEMAELFDAIKQNISLRLKNIFDDGELEAAATVKEFLIVQTEGSCTVQCPVTLHNLYAILAVGYRVRSPRCVQFRRWASIVLKEFLVKGFMLDDERLKNPHGRLDDFDEMLAHIRDIRGLERRDQEKAVAMTRHCSILYRLYRELNGSVGHRKWLPARGQFATRCVANCTDAINWAVAEHSSVGREGWGVAL